MNKQEILKLFFQSTLGLPYIWGGQNPLVGYDCSGFVQEALITIGLDPKGDQTSHALYEHFRNPKFGVRRFLQFGSVLFFGREDRISHTAIALNQFSMIESGGGGSQCKTREDAIKYNAFVRIRPISRRKDLVDNIYPIGMEE